MQIRAERLGSARSCEALSTHTGDSRVGGDGELPRGPGGLEASPAEGGGPAAAPGTSGEEAPEPSPPSSRPPPAPREQPSEVRPAQATGLARGVAPGRIGISFARKRLAPSRGVVGLPCQAESAATRGPRGEAPPQPDSPRGPSSGRAERGPSTLSGAALPPTPRVASLLLGARTEAVRALGLRRGVNTVP